jgi:hypothetical protein
LLINGGIKSIVGLLWRIIDGFHFNCHFKGLVLEESHQLMTSWAAIMTFGLSPLVTILVWSIMFLLSFREKKKKRKKKNY